MANTYTQIYIQFVFAVQDRISLIRENWKDELYKYITGIIQNYNHKLIAINGTSNHFHILVGYKPNQSIPDLMKNVKGFSSKWINEKRFVKGKFKWQEGYGAFSYSISQIDTVVKYINNQAEHHKMKSFNDEYQAFLKNFKVDYNEDYMLKDV